MTLADAALKLEKLVRDGRPLCEVESAEGLQWMLDARAVLAALGQARKGKER